MKKNRRDNQKKQTQLKLKIKINKNINKYIYSKTMLKNKC